MSTIKASRSFLSSRLLLPTLFTLALSGCGGGGSGALGTGASATLSASPKTAVYNAPVTVSWGGHKVLSVESSDFGLSPSQTSGTLTDNPGIDTSYTFTVSAQNDGHDPISITKTATVHVVPSTKSVLIVGNAGVAGPNQVLDSLRSITTGTVTIGPTLPASTSADVIVLHPSAALSVSDRPSLDALLSAGKAVVFIGNTVSDLSGGDVSSLGGYLAGATSIDGGTNPSFRSVAGPVTISSKWLGVPLDAHEAGLLNVSTSADRLLTGGPDLTFAFAYNVPSGGRTGFVLEDGVGSSQKDIGYDVALRTISRWCMDGF